MVSCFPFLARQFWDPGRIRSPPVWIFWLTLSCFPSILEPECTSQGTGSSWQAPVPVGRLSLTGGL